MVNIKMYIAFKGHGAMGWLVMQGRIINFYQLSWIETLLCHIMYLYWLVLKLKLSIDAAYYRSGATYFSFMENIGIEYASCDSSTRGRSIGKAC